ncbi:uncharacterized protein B0I36DRAFT_429117 [Microdochium trichocladiopsis]|uniref:Uncharacterized protein n=1 Tax=Microdochium trichocladiopsis TaxID=1682393 RepID=A0A9P8YBK2_9PEZI|nr:uncharacterized protein B0I36DRAFT_429117 [Microdochium trichocladiopsis]KAH7034865.1 hypothetical protein B0I36DRAFT_429117 [Microdochium trichocladiopsis]
MSTLCRSSTSNRACMAATTARSSWSSALISSPALRRGAPHLITARPGDWSRSPLAMTASLEFAGDRTPRQVVSTPTDRQDEGVPMVMMQSVDEQPGPLFVAGQPWRAGKTFWTLPSCHSSTRLILSETLDITTTLVARVALDLAMHLVSPRA